MLQYKRFTLLCMYKSLTMLKNKNKQKKKSKEGGPFSQPKRASQPKKQGPHTTPVTPQPSWDNSQPKLWPHLL